MKVIALVSQVLSTLCMGQGTNEIDDVLSLPGTCMYVQKAILLVYTKIAGEAKELGLDYTVLQLYCWMASKFLVVVNGIMSLGLLS